MLCLPLQLCYQVTEAVSDQRREDSSVAVEEEIVFMKDETKVLY